MKQCHVCLAFKSIDDFYHSAINRRHVGDGHDNRCKECVKNHAKSPEVREHTNELRRNRGKSENDKERNRQWQKKNDSTEQGKQKRRERGKKYYWANRDKRLSEQYLFRQTESFKKAVQTHREKYPERRKAQIAVMNAVATKKLIRPEYCSVCGINCKPEGHHFDYSQPLVVIWVCKKCHSDYHLSI